MRTLILIVALCVSAVRVGQAACLVSTPNLTDPNGTLKTSNGYGWFGSERLAAMIPSDGHWTSKAPADDYWNKFWWWQKDFTKKAMPEHGLVVKAVKLGTNSEFITVSTTGYASEGSDNYSWNAMIVGMEFPSNGCWKVTGKFADAELNIILQVGAYE